MRYIKYASGLVILITAFGLAWNWNRNINTRQEAGEPEIGNEQSEKSQSLPNNVLLDAPFTSQAPTANWDDPRQQDGCEEASMLMAVFWATGKALGSAEENERALLAISDYEQAKYGNYHDTSAEDTVKWAKDYFKYDNLAHFYDIDVQDIKKELSQGNLVVVPVDGTKLGNPNFSGSGPPRHMLVIRGFDEKNKEFITNDPGTRKGRGYRYDYNVLLQSVLNYPTGHLKPIIDNRTVMIVVKK